MKMFKVAAKAAAGLALAGIFAVSGAVSAQALNFQWTITNSLSTSITLDRATCSVGGSISAPFSIASGATVTFTGTSSASSDLCNVRYQGGSLNALGCQFQVQTNGSTGFSSSNAYKGSGSSPHCNNPSNGPITGGWSGTFNMAP